MNRRQPASRAAAASAAVPPAFTRRASARSLPIVAALCTTSSMPSQARRAVSGSTKSPSI